MAGVFPMRTRRVPGSPARLCGPHRHVAFSREGSTRGTGGTVPQTADKHMEDCAHWARGPWFVRFSLAADGRMAQSGVTVTVPWRTKEVSPCEWLRDRSGAWPNFPESSGLALAPLEFDRLLRGTHWSVDVDARTYAASPGGDLAAACATRAVGGAGCAGQCFDGTHRGSHRGSHRRCRLRPRECRRATTTTGIRGGLELLALTDGLRRSWTDFEADGDGDDAALVVTPRRR